MRGTGRRTRIPPLGAYGIRLRGLDGAARLLVPVAVDAPAFALSAEVGLAETGEEWVGDERAALLLRNGGQVLVDRRAGRVRFRIPHPVRPDELVHPYLAPVAAVVGRWNGHESVHAGAFVAGGRAWGLIGERAAGKSSLLAWLAGAGVEVLSDDMVIVAAGRALAGPRSIDLREDAAGRLGIGEPIGMTGARERWRLELGAVRAAAELAGWVYLAWGEGVAARELTAAERVARIAPQRGLRLPPVRPDALLELASLPAWELSRPRDWTAMPRVAERLLELASATPTAGA